MGACVHLYQVVFPTSHRLRLQADPKLIFTFLRYLAAKRNTITSMLCRLLYDKYFYWGRACFGRRWVESEATKDGVDADIAKYDGEWTIESPTIGGFSEDRGLVMKVNPPFLIFHHSMSLFSDFCKTLCNFCDV